MRYAAFKIVAGSLLITAIVPLAGSSASADETQIETQIKKASLLNRMIVETNLADKYCPHLKQDSHAVQAALIRVAGSADVASQMLGAFNSTDQSQAYLDQKIKIFKRPGIPRDLACEMARLAFGTQDGVVGGLLVKR